MILNTLRLEHYKQYGRLELDFREGLVGIVGRNGAGKSTLFEAVLYCLFGRDDSDKTLIRSVFADPKAVVSLQLSFTLGLERYEVRREFRGKTLTVGAELYKNDTLIAKGVAAVNNEVERLLGMERDTFVRSVFSGQSELAELSNLKKGERKVKVRRMLGLDALDDIQSRVNRDLNDLNNRIAGQRQNLLDEEILADIQREVERLGNSLETNYLQQQEERQKLHDLELQYQLEKQKFDELDQQRKRHSALEQALAQLRERLANFSRQGEALAKKQQELQALRQKTDAGQAVFSQYEQDRKALERLENLRQGKINRDAYLLRIEELQTPAADITNQLEQIRAELAGQEDLARQLEEQQRLARLAEQEIEAKRAEYQELDGEARVLKSRMEERREKIATLQAIGKTGACPTCFQPLLDAYDTVLADLSGDIEGIQNQQLVAIEAQKANVTEQGIALKSRLADLLHAVEQLKRRSDHLSDLARQKTKAEQELQRLEAQRVKIELILRELGEVDFDEMQYQDLKTRLDDAEPRYREWQNNLHYLRREEPNTQQERAQNAAALSEAENLFARKNTELESTGFDALRYEAAKQGITSFAEVLRVQSDALNTLEKAGLGLENEIRQRQDKLAAHAEMQARIRDRLAEAEDLEKLQKMFGAFKNEILEKISPAISREASELFSRITHGKYESIRVDENFDFSIADGGIYYPIERFSGGEIDLANFCLRIAVTKAIVELNGTAQGVEFLAFDEIFGSQDEERRHEIMLALHYLQEQFRQIYIVSHIESIRDYFPNILEVKSSPAGGSTARWVD